MDYHNGGTDSPTLPVAGGPVPHPVLRSSMPGEFPQQMNENRKSASRRSLPRKPVPISRQQSAAVLPPPGQMRNGNAPDFDGDQAQDFTRRVSKQSDSSSLSAGTNGQYTPDSRDVETPEPQRVRVSSAAIPDTQTLPYRHQAHASFSLNVAQPQQAEVAEVEAAPRRYSFESEHTPSEVYPQLQYHHRPFDDGSSSNASQDAIRPEKRLHRQSRSGDFAAARKSNLGPDSPRTTLPRPASAYTLSNDLTARGRNGSPMLSPDMAGFPGSASPRTYARASSSHRRSPDSRPISYIDLLNTPYAQQVAPASLSLDNTQLRSVVGSNASLLDSTKTLEMYRANVKKTNDPATQYEFAVLMVQAAMQQPATQPAPQSNGSASLKKANPTSSPQADMIREARQILQRLSDRGYPFAQYYLGDGYASGLFSKGKEDYDHAFPLFLAASKHGHAESGYRAGLCYEFGWGTRKDYAKAAQFYRQSASKNHPGSATRLGKACLTNDLCLHGRYREGIKWLKRAAESADQQYNAAPYELGLLHLDDFGTDIFKDEAYAAQLFTKSADLGHAEASLMLGRAYEHGLLCCPRDAALSVHFYNGAASGGIPEAMMALCAWYMLGAPPLLQKDESEAYEWAKRAAELGMLATVLSAFVSCTS